MKFRHIGPSRTKSIFKFASPKMGKMFKLESSLEYYTCFHLEYSSDVKAYIAQPGPIEYLLNGEPENFFPDFWVDSTKNSTYLLEVKHSSKISNPEFRYKFQLKRNAPVLNGLPIVLITEHQICQNPILNNLKLIHHYAGIDLITPIHEWILNFVTLYGQNRIQILIEKSNYSAADIISASVNLIANGRLKADIHETELGKSSLVSSLVLNMTNRELGIFDDEFDNDHSEEKISEKISEYIPPDIEQYSDNNQKKAYQKLALIKWLEKRIAAGWTKKNLSPLLVDAQSHFKFELPNWRTVARWHSEYCQSGKAIEALVPKHHRKGMSGHQKRDDGIFFEKILKEHYLTTRRPSIASSYILYKSYITNENSKLDGIKLVPLSRRAFFYRIKKLPPYETALRRYGRDYADRNFRTIGQLPKVSRVLERVEIDHTPLDLILVDDDLLLAIGRPYITALIDCYSKCIVGLYIGYKEPSYDSVRRALVNACLSKDWIKNIYPCVKKDWPCEGKIGVLVPDNANEFWSSSLDDACLSQVGDIDFNQVGKPWLKPLIERFFGTLSKEFLVSIPGKTFSNVTELKGYKPEKDAVMRFSTFIELFYKWIIDIYHYQPSSNGTEIPILKWNESVERINVPIYRDYSAEKLLIDLAKVDICSLGNDGIHINNLRYSSDELTSYRKITEPKQGEKNPQVKVKTLHTSVAEIYVYLDSEKRYIKVPCVDQEYAYGLTLLQHQTNIRFVKRYIESKAEIEHLAEAKVYLHERIIQEITDVTKLLNKRKANIGSAKKMAKFNDIGSDNINSLSSGFGKINSTKENNEDNSWDDYKPTEDSYE